MKAFLITVKMIRKKIAIVSVIIIVMICLVNCAVLPRFGRSPKGEILEKMEASPNYSENRFHNYSPRIEREGSSFKGWLDFLFGKRVEGFRPSESLPSVKTNLKELDRKEDVLVWLGHSSLFIQIDGVRFLIDPVLVTGSPVPFFNRPFCGTKIYKPDDIPDIDYLLISHDHWDHLDYKAVTKLRNRIGTVICGLGVGEHFRRWRFNPDNIIELDWNESVSLKNNIILHILPSQHGSARNFLKMDRTLWVSFMIEAPSSTIFISGDTGYGPHFNDIGKHFSKIDFAIIEFGQWGEGWKHRHIMPDELVKAINNLNPLRCFAYHNSKYTLTQHSWFEPLEIVSELNKQDGLNIITPMIGELIDLNDLSQGFSLWWREIP